MSKRDSELARLANLTVRAERAVGHLQAEGMRTLDGDALARLNDFIERAAQLLESWQPPA